MLQKPTSDACKMYNHPPSEECRVAVNSCVADYQLGIQLLELKCNVHLLDSMQISAQAHYLIMMCARHIFGHNCCAVNYIMAIKR